ncbi:MAG: hypothetical protein LBL90_02520 [Prevotellaceae bacterium]|nr:hypothetical protein [Prevotellaceae bacterium]
MKKAVILLCAVLFCLPLADQKKVYRPTKDNYSLKNGDYVADTGINKFVGRWEWKSGNSSFTLIIKKREKVKYIHNSNFMYYSDNALGWYRYIKNGVEVKNTLDNVHAGMTATDLKNILSKTSISGVSKEGYLGLLVQINGFKMRQDARLESIPGKTDEIRWTIYNKYNRVAKAKQEDFPIPVSMVLKKATELDPLLPPEDPLDSGGPK